MEKQQKRLLQIIMTVAVREITCNELLYGTHDSERGRDTNSV